MTALAISGGSWVSDDGALKGDAFEHWMAAGSVLRVVNVHGLCSPHVDEAIVAWKVRAAGECREDDLDERIESGLPSLGASWALLSTSTDPAVLTAELIASDAVYHTRWVWNWRTEPPVARDKL